MTPGQLMLKEATGWLVQSAKDLNAARVLITVEPSRSVLHSQQAAEKAVKGFLAFHDTPFRKTHDIGELGQQATAFDATLGALLTQAESLSSYSIVYPYPDTPAEPDGGEASEALDLAERVYGAVNAAISR